jgi:hypothetical protein
MTIANGLLIAFAVFCLVTLRVFQQKNAQHEYYVWGVLTSYGIAFAEIALILNVVEMGYAAGWYVGSGGALGFITALYIHKRFVRKDN